MNGLLARQGQGMNALTATIAAMVVNTPTLDDLTQAQLEAVAKMVIAEGLKDELKSRLKKAGIDWQEEKEQFLKTRKSDYTAAAYRHSLANLEAWAQDKSLDTLAFTAKEADDYIYSMTSTDRATAAIRLDIAAASAFYSFLARRYEGIIYNPFKGTKATPQQSYKKKIAVPTAEEVKTIIAALPPLEAAAAAVCAYRGLRIGALPTLTLDGAKYEGKSKGKVLEGGVKLPKEARDAITAAGLDPTKPFDGMNVGLIKRRLNYAVKKLVKAGKLAAPYSHHDLRHFFAVTEYRKDKDIYKLKKLLNHASIAITEKYLRSMGEL
jgi:site-specific recombinase XerD